MVSTLRNNNKNRLANNVLPSRAENFNNINSANFNRRTNVPAHLNRPRGNSANLRNAVDGSNWNNNNNVRGNTAQRVTTYRQNANNRRLNNNNPISSTVNRASNTLSNLRGKRRL